MCCCECVCARDFCMFDARECVSRVVVVRAGGSSAHCIHFVHSVKSTESNGRETKICGKCTVNRARRRIQAQRKCIQNREGERENEKRTIYPEHCVRKHTNLQCKGNEATITYSVCVVLHDGVCSCQLGNRNPWAQTHSQLPTQCASDVVALLSIDSFAFMFRLAFCAFAERLLIFYVRGIHKHKHTHTSNSSLFNSSGG